MAASISGLTYSIICHINLQNNHSMRVHDSSGLINAILAGLVAITGSCNNVSILGSIIIGIVGSFVYMIAGKLMVRWKIDDPVEAS